MALSTRELLARLLKCEAGGEGENGMRAVASVIVNRTRVPNGEFARVSKGGDFRAIMEQPNQFTCLKQLSEGNIILRMFTIYVLTKFTITLPIGHWRAIPIHLSEIQFSILIHFQIPAQHFFRQTTE